MKSAVTTGAIIAVFFVLAQSGCQDVEKIEISTQCIEEVISDYFKKETPLDLVDEVRFENDSGQIITLKEEYLEKIGVNLNKDWDSLAPGVKNITLSIRQTEESSKPELCSIIEMGRDRKMWFYPIVQVEGRCEIERSGSGEFILFEIKNKDSVIINGTEATTGTVRPYSKLVSHRSKNGIRALVVVDDTMPQELANEATHEILLGASNAKILIRKRGVDGRVGKLTKWTEQDGDLNE